VKTPKTSSCMCRFIGESQTEACTSCLYYLFLTASGATISNLFMQLGRTFFRSPASQVISFMAQPRICWTGHPAVHSCLV